MLHPFVEYPNQFHGQMVVSLFQTSPRFSRNGIAVIANYDMSHFERTNKNDRQYTKSDTALYKLLDLDTSSRTVQYSTVK